MALQGADKIDFVIAWVDGSDTKWYEEKALYQKGITGDNREVRYRDWDILRYWFRGVEEFAPWVNKIHFVTWGHMPEWLDINHPKLNVVHHKDFIPSKYLPTFNANTIEMNFHRIPNLSEHFVYFNDDIFLIKHVKPEQYFVDGLPCDMLAFQPIVVKPDNTIMAHIFLNNTDVLSKYFDKRNNVKSQPGNYFKLGYPPLYLAYNILELTFPLYTGFFNSHGAAPLCKESYQQIWEKENVLLDETCRNKFRSKQDVNQYLIREWQKLSGRFHAKNIVRNFRYFEVGHDNTRLYNTIKKQKVSSICINDANSNFEFEKVKIELQQTFEIILSKKSLFEL